MRRPTARCTTDPAAQVIQTALPRRPGPAYSGLHGKHGMDSLGAGPLGSRGEDITMGGRVEDTLSACITVYDRFGQVIILGPFKANSPRQ